MHARQSLIDAFVQCLTERGVRKVFGFPGESTLPLYVAYDRNPAIEHIMAGCERCAGYMADVYARLTYSLGIVDSPGGIGSPWLVPAICEAGNSAIPILAILSGSPLSLRERWTTDRMPQKEVFGPIVRKFLTLENPDRLEDFVTILISASLGVEPGPCIFEIPTDLMTAPGPWPSATKDVNVTYPRLRNAPCIKSLKKAVALIRKSARPIILAGGGVHASRAYQELEEFSRRHNIPVVTSLNGKGAVDEEGERALGVVGNKGTTIANDFFRTRDLLIVAGSKLGDKTTANFTLLGDGVPMIRINSNPKEFEHSGSHEIALLGDIRETIQRLLDFDLPVLSKEDFVSVRERIKDDIAKRYEIYGQESLPVCPLLLVQEINRRYQGNAIICADASGSSGWVGAIGLSRGGRRNIVTPRGTGSLGFGFPATLAAKIACPTATVFGIGGDAGFAMSCHEIETACRLNLDIHYFVLQNGSLGMLERVLKTRRHDAVLPKRHPTDWETIARGFGARAVTLRTNLDVKTYFESLQKGPTIVQVMVNSAIDSPEVL